MKVREFKKSVARIGSALLCTNCLHYNITARSYCRLCQGSLAKSTLLRTASSNGNVARIILRYVSARNMQKDRRRKATWSLLGNTVFVSCPCCDNIVQTPFHDFKESVFFEEAAVPRWNAGNCLVCGKCKLHIFPCLENWVKAVERRCGEKKKKKKRRRI